MNSDVACRFALLDGQLELDINLGLFGQRYNFRKLYNLEKKIEKGIVNISELTFNYDHLNYNTSVKKSDDC